MALKMKKSPQPYDKGREKRLFRWVVPLGLVEPAALFFRSVSSTCSQIGRSFGETLLIMAPQLASRRFYCPSLASIVPGKGICGIVGG